MTKQVSFVPIIGVLFAALLSFGGIIIQLQFMSLSASLTTEHSERLRWETRTEHNQEKLETNVKAEAVRREKEIKQSVYLVEGLLRDRSQQFPTQLQFNEFKTAIRDDIVTIREQLRVIESTRPTTGELRSNSKAFDATLGRLEDRVRNLELYQRSPAPGSGEPLRGTK